MVLAVSECQSVTVSECHSVTVSQCQSVRVSQCHSVSSLMFTKMVNSFLLPYGSQNYHYEGLIMIKLTANFQEIMSTSDLQKWAVTV